MSLFTDRQEAGEKLARALRKYKGADSIVFAIPRGGVEVAYPVARELCAPLNVIVARKIGAPGNEELAIGAVTPDGTSYWNEAVLAGLGIQREELKTRIKKTVEEIKRRMALYEVEPQIPDLTEKTAIVVDDGIATGLTVLAALRSLREKKPDRIIIAVPVAPRDTVEQLKKEADEVVCLYSPVIFYAVGQFYQTFPQTSDKKVISLLKKSRDFLS